MLVFELLFWYWLSQLKDWVSPMPGPPACLTLTLLSVIPRNSQEFPSFFVLWNLCFRELFPNNFSYLGSREFWGILVQINAKEFSGRPREFPVFFWTISHRLGDVEIRDSGHTDQPIKMRTSVSYLMMERNKWPISLSRMKKLAFWNPV